ncbi:hypothetical protein K402DRAFT_337603 [Aulographum hederae CBS 113979]|uniref:Septin-type G domain-containing protein n=1 Tax=Aulographum hederae CBS 113979 TaxID=1176131 RepID=A0A6G1GSS6_9PEZI|nr:hypothetical protein K402DRAFT_337603 [Aulographum hederae CBS 113979]
MAAPSAVSRTSPSPGLSPSPEDPSRSRSNGETRRTSFGFLRRQKSSDPANRSVSSGKMSKKQRQMHEEELARQQREAALRSPPTLPTHSPLPKINTFGGPTENRNGGFHQGDPQVYDQFHARTSPQPHAIPVPPIPAHPGSRNGDHDPYARTESMTHRGRYSYASSAVSMGTNSPRRVRRRKDPTPFNILVIGAKNSGKTSFINFLRSSLSSPPKKRKEGDRHHSPSPPHTAVSPDSPFVAQYLETEVDSERVGLTLWDSQGLEKNVVDLQLREMASFLESKFEETFTEEQKVVRAPGVRDTHIHCVFLILDPIRLDENLTALRKNKKSPTKFSAPQRLIGMLDEDLDLQVLRTLQGKTTVIPVISKADTITSAHMTLLKKTVWDSLKQAKLDPLEALNLDDSESEDSDRLDERDEDEYNHSGPEEEDQKSQTSEYSDAKPGADRSSVSDLEVESEAVEPSSPIHALTTEISTPATSPPAAHGPVITHNRNSSAMSAAILAAAASNEVPFLPLSIISPDIYDPGVIGRRFPWGFADPYNAEHCDFIRLKDTVFTEWRAELREASREIWYEGWRTSRLNRRGATPARQGGRQGMSASPGHPMQGRSNGGDMGKWGRAVVSATGVDSAGSPEMKRNGGSGQYVTI